MKKQNKKNGFTLVELLVVIAILAILATVSVIGYLSFTEKAKQSNDETLIAQLNTALQANEAIDGKPKTMSEALKVVEESGFLVENLTPTSAKNEFMWDQENNKFIIVSEETLGETTNSNYWVIVNDETLLTDLQDNYSVYLGNNYTDEDGIVNVANGFDAGNFEGINTINFATEEEITVTIRTNGGTLNVNASNAAVNHYGSANVVDITAVDMNSYHEYGNATKISILEGHLIVYKNSVVLEVEISDAASASSIMLDINSQNTTILVPEGQEGNFTNSINGGIIVDKSNLKIEGIDGYGTKNSPYMVDDIDGMDEILSIENREVYVKLISDLTYDTIVKPTKDTAFIYVKQEQLVNIDLNGYTISGTLITDGNTYASAHIIYNDGVLNLFNSNNIKLGQIIDLSTTANACTRTVKNNANGVLTLDGVRVTSTNSVGMINLGYCKVNNSTIESLNTTLGGGGWNNSTSGIENRSDGRLDIYSSHIESKTRAALFCDANDNSYVNIYSGELYGNSSYGAINGSSQNIIKIYGGTFSSDVSTMTDMNYYCVEVGSSTFETYKIEKRKEKYIYSLSELKVALEDSFGKKLIYSGNLSLNEHIKLNQTDVLEITGSLNFESDGYITNFDNVIVNGQITGVINFENGVYKIYDAMDFQWLNYIATENESINVELMNDIVFPEDSTFVPINIFKGEFNGNGHKISNLNIYSISADTGIFQYLMDANIHDITFENVNINTQTSYTGGLAGMIIGSNTFENITINGKITVSGASYGVAAFIGSINDSSGTTNTFINCISNLNISAEFAYNVGTIYGTSSGSVSTVGIYNCANNGNITAAGSVGIVFGYGNLKGDSHLEIIGFINNGIVKYSNGTILNSDSYLGASSTGSIYNKDYADGRKYRAVKLEDGTWSWEEIVLE